MITHNNQIFRNWFAIIHYHLTKVSSRINKCIIFEPNELSITVSTLWCHWLFSYGLVHTSQYDRSTDTEMGIKVMRIAILAKSASTHSPPNARLWLASRTTLIEVHLNFKAVAQKPNFTSCKWQLPRRLLYVK